MTFVASWFTHLLRSASLLAPCTDLTGCPASGAFTSGLPADWSPFPLQDIPTTATGLLVWDFFCQRDLSVRRIFFFVSFFVRSEGPVSSSRSALRSRRRAQELSRLAVAPTSRHAPPLPGHTLTAPSTTARLVRFG
jgi:hypothetical protein